MKVIPIKSGVYSKVIDKRRYRYDLKEGVAIEIPEKFKDELKKKGFIGRSTKTKIKKDKEIDNGTDRK